MINFCYDTVLNGQGYPNLARWSAQPFTQEWRKFDQHWPRTVPLRLTMYLDDAAISYNICSVHTSPPGSWYPICFSWFDFDCDYIELMPSLSKERVKNKDIKILFYYHEGDNPVDIKKRVDELCRLHDLANNCYVFVSANSAASDLENFIYFQDHESFFRHVNRDQATSRSVNLNRDYEFTMLNRAHKWWRASCTEDLLHHGVLKNSQWSYHTHCEVGDDIINNPIEIWRVRGWKARILDFVAKGPYFCDQLDLIQKNNHQIINQGLYSKSFFNIVTETFMTIHQSTGSFVTEKTFKCIKYGQPFVIIGTPGTLKLLQDSGYKTFDSVLDNTYDTIKDPTQRWIAIRELLINMKQQGVKNLFVRCQEDILYNQQIFTERKILPLNILLKELACQN